MLDKDVHYRFERNFSSPGISFGIWEQRAGKRFVVEELVFKEIPEGDWCSPAARLSDHEAQGMMDSLWDAGIRPTAGSGSAGAMNAVEKHLGDMRKIAFNRLKIEG